MSATSQKVSESGLSWWDVHIVMLDDSGAERRVACTFLSLDAQSAYDRGVAFIQSEKCKPKSLSVKLADKPPGIVRPLDAPALPAPEKKEESKPKLTPEQARAVAAFTLVPINVDIRLYTSDGGSK